MTPDEARALLDGTTPGQWEVDHDHAWAPGVWSPGSIVFGPYYDREDMEQWEAGSDADLRLAAHAPDMAAMVAGMHEEWGVRWDDDPSYGPYDWGFPTRAAAEQWEKKSRHYGPERGRVVRRYTTEPEVG